MTTNLHIIICTNDETLEQIMSDVFEIVDDSRDELADAYVKAVYELADDLDIEATPEPSFTPWHGGYCSHQCTGAISGGVVAYGETLEWRRMIAAYFHGAGKMAARHTARRLAKRTAEADTV